jgi:hypothetical protein
LRFGGPPLRFWLFFLFFQHEVAEFFLETATLLKVKTDPILYVGRLEDKLTEFIHANGDYLFAIFAFFCLLAIAWLLSRQRKSPPPDLLRLEREQLSEPCSRLRVCLQTLTAVARV